MMKILLTFFILLFVSGCGSDKKLQVAAPKPLPSWYTNPPISDSQYLYETAEGVDKKEAVANALDAMAATLSVEIASEYKSHKTVRDGAVSSYQHDVDNTVQTKVNAIRISNYKVIESKEQGFRRHLVLIKSDKKALFADLKKELDEKIILLQDKEHQIGNKNIVEQLRFYRETDSSFVTLESTLNVMNVLNRGFDSTPYLKTKSHYTTRYSALLNKVTVSLESNNHAEGLIAPVQAALSAKKIIVQNRQDSYHLTIEIDAKINYVHEMGFDLARSAITLTTKDSSNRTLGSNKLNIVGQSTQGDAVAKENVAIKLKRMIDKEGIAKVLGLKL